LERLGYTLQVPWSRLEQEGVVEGDRLNHTRTGFQFAGRSNGVSNKHVAILRTQMADTREGRPWFAITNAQHALYWSDPVMYRAAGANDADAFRARKIACKKLLFEEVADQTGKWLDDQIMTLVFAKRFCSYKRATLLLQDFTRFESLISNDRYPIQLIWAGKPYPVDYSSIAEFDRLVHECKRQSRCAILTGYELKLSRLLKQGADVWLNVPRSGHEASGTSGMTAAMNGAVNLSLSEGWFDEFAQDGQNSFLIPAADPTLSDVEQDRDDAQRLYAVLEKTVLPLFYERKEEWFQVVRNSMLQVRPRFDSDRMVKQYVEELYDPVRRS